MDQITYPLSPTRLLTRRVQVGSLGLGGQEPIRIQSMLVNSATKPDACLAEIKALDQAGCEIIRLSIPSPKELEAIPQLRRLLLEEGITRPLVADIHFSPRLAEEACAWFEKVRINPGNYVDTPKNRQGQSSKDAFLEGRARLKEAVLPLVQALKRHDRALRIGVNQGSLSQRMMDQFGDSPLGMVHSALEMCQLFEEEGFYNLVISLKSSNPLVVQKAYRLLVEMQAGREKIPLHLGVTEAGDGLMGRIKSLAGMAPLLLDGLGDTIRVSLTEPAVAEIPFAQSLLGGLKLPTWGSSQGGWQRSWLEQRRINPAHALQNAPMGAAAPLLVGVSASQTLPPLETDFTPDFTYNKQGESFELPWLDQSRSNQAFTLLNEAQPLLALRRLYVKHTKGLPGPVGLLFPFDPKSLNLQEEAELAGALSEGLLDFVLLQPGLSAEALERILMILQATRAKSLVADYIACPSCARTLFDLTSATAKIKARTSHLKNVKIGIMGCVVNGPGEMADADFGYVGSGQGLVDLYFGQARVKRNIPEAEAVEELIALIQQKGMWQEPKKKTGG